MSYGAYSIPSRIGTVKGVYLYRSGLNCYKCNSFFSNKELNMERYKLYGEFRASGLLLGIDVTLKDKENLKLLDISW